MTETPSAVRDRELCYLTVTELGRHFRAGELSPVEVTHAVLRRIAQLEPQLNAFVLVDPEAALANAKASEARYHAGTPLSELDGVTVSLKDLLLARGWPTRKGSRTTAAEGPWQEDSPAAARLREAGAVLLGKTTTSELGLKGMGDSPLTGITRNPWNLDHSPGGSSAGAVAAVAAGLGALAVGTDGGGSIRVPAAFTGVVGLKPTFGRVPTYPAGVIGAPPARRPDHAQCAGRYGAAARAGSSRRSRSLSPAPRRAAARPSERGPGGSAHRLQRSPVPRRAEP